MPPDTLTAILAALGGSVCAILALRTPPGAHLTNVRAVERDILALRQAAERRTRRRRRIWLAIVIAGALLLLALALTDRADAAPLATPAATVAAAPPSPYSYCVITCRDCRVRCFRLPPQVGQRVDDLMGVRRYGVLR